MPVLSKLFPCSLSTLSFDILGIAAAMKGANSDVNRLFDKSTTVIEVFLARLSLNFCFHSSVRLSGFVRSKHSTPVSSKRWRAQPQKSHRKRYRNCFDKPKGVRTKLAA